METTDSTRNEVVTEAQKSLAPIAIEFQPDAIEIEERPVPPASRWVLYSLVALVIFGILWASFSRVDRVVTSTGKLITSNQLILLQPLETSVIREINVEVGDIVEKDDILVTLDPTFTAADVSQVRGRIASLDAEIFRLEAEFETRQKLYKDDEAKKLQLQQQLQQAIFNARQAEYSARIDNFRDRLAGIEASIKTNRAEISGLEERDKVLGEIEGIFSELQDRKAGSRLRYLEQIERRLAIKNNLGSLRSKNEELRRQGSSLKAEQEAFIEQWRREIIEQLVKSRRELAQLQEELSKAERRSNLVNMKAPQKAVVLEVAQRSVGSVIKAAEPLVTLVPMPFDLEAEVEINPSNIGYIGGERDNDVRIKLSAFPFQKHGTLNGKIKTITNSTVQGQGPATDGDGNPIPTAGGPKQIYKAIVTISDTSTLRSLPKNFQLLPGMTLTAEIKVGSQNVMYYLINPLIKVFDESIREP